MNINQIIHKPTHCEGNILDFLLTNNTDSIFSYTCSPTIHSDHFIIEVMTHLNFENMGIQSEERNLKSNFDLYNFNSQKIDWELINKELADINWPEALDTNFNPDQQYNNFLEVFLQVLDKNLPLRKPPKNILEFQEIGAF